VPINYGRQNPTPLGMKNSKIQELYDSCIGTAYKLA